MRSRKKISKNITYTEATKSNTAIKYGIDNTPSEIEMEAMKYVAENVFQKVREKFKVPIAVTSFYRSVKLNKKIGGSSTSQHCKGEAIDLDADVFKMVTNKEIFDYIYKNLEYDQLIWEYGTNKEPAWVHVSLKKCNNRKQALVAYKESNWNGKTVTKYKNYEG
jgi:zinc D-Ala-D-Ala carboxypeptidase